MASISALQQSGDPGRDGASVHRDGAWDYKAPSYQKLSEVWDFWIAHADALNIQEIHDYAGNRAGEQRAWRTGVGWHSANVGQGPLGPYTHVERNWDGAKDQRTIPEIVTGATTFRPPTTDEESDGLDMTPDELKVAVESAVLNALTNWQRAEKSKGSSRPWFARRPRRRARPDPLGRIQDD